MGTVYVAGYGPVEMPRVRLLAVGRVQWGGENCGASVKADMPFVFGWRNTADRAVRFGQRCRVVRRARQTALVEFLDGHLMVTSVRALRRAFGKAGA